MMTFRTMGLAVVTGSLVLVAGARIAQGESHSQALRTEAVAECGRLRQADTRYKLSRNVQSPGTCFSIEADNVTLDLNGHAINYAMETSAIATFGVISADCWYKPIDGNPCGGTHRHTTVMNGLVTQGPGAAPFSHALRFGQATETTGIVVHNLTIRVHADDSIPIYGEYLPGGSDIYGNTIFNMVKTITSRTQFRGASIKLDEEETAKLPDRIHDNVIRGGPQLGIRSDNPAGTQIFNNDISQDAVYTNGFCIDAAGFGMHVFGNQCHPVHGRGIHANHSNVQIDHNVVTTIDSDKNEEYHGCEINGTYGIQLEDDGNKPTNMAVFNNKVTVHAHQCAAEAMRVTELHGAAIQIHDNTFVAVEDLPGDDPEHQDARAFSVGASDGSATKIYNNVMIADSAIFHVDWDGGSSFTLEKNTFQAGSHHTVMADFENGAEASHDIRFADDTYKGFDFAGARFGPHAADSGYLVQRSFHFHGTQGSGKPIKNVQAKIEAGPDHTLLQGNSSTAGDLLFLLPVVRVENGKPTQKYSSYNLTAEAAGCRTFTRKLPADGKPLTQAMTCR